MDEHQWVTAIRLGSIFANTDTFSSVYGTGASASDTVLDVESYGLPPDQWKIEAEGWFETSLAKMQAYAVEFANNRGLLGRLGSLSFPGSNSSTLPVWHAQCGHQRSANPGGYQNFSFPGVMVLCCFGVLACFGKIVTGLWTSIPVYSDLMRTQSCDMNETLKRHATREDADRIILDCIYSSYGSSNFTAHVRSTTASWPEYSSGSA